MPQLWAQISQKIIFYDYPDLFAIQLGIYSSIEKWFQTSILVTFSKLLIAASEHTVQWCSFWYESMCLGSKDFILHRWLAVLHIFREMKDFCQISMFSRLAGKFRKSSIFPKICNTASHLYIGWSLWNLDTLIHFKMNTTGRSLPSIPNVVLKVHFWTHRLPVQYNTTTIFKWTNYTNKSFWL